MQLPRQEAPRPCLHVVRVAGISIELQLAVEEALLRADARNWFIWNQGSAPAVVLGISGKIQELIDRTAWESSGFPLIRRFSGGGTVIVDEETLFASWIVNHRDLPDVNPEPGELLQWVGSLIEPLGIGIKAQDFVHGERKIGGNAQYLRRDRWLHHTSFLWNFRQDRMDILRMPAKRPDYRGARDHCSFCQPLAEHLASPDDLLQTILERLRAHFQVVFVEWEQACAALELPHRKSVRCESWPEL
jgi:lipoate-protein ligase A